MMTALLAHKDYLRVLHAITRGPTRFFRLQEELELHPPQLHRALKFLLEGGYVRLAVADTETRYKPLMYVATRRGEAMWSEFMKFATSVRRRPELGPKDFRDLQSCWY
ncbi:MAG: hypothetical protein M0D55_10565 [Elusimicrobiota bacterium]|nr:MAG: hypothetical protein M0D55_10565 [Elusimicrobiota bacterium]